MLESATRRNHTGRTTLSICQVVIALQILSGAGKGETIQKVLEKKLDFLSDPHSRFCGKPTNNSNSIEVRRTEAYTSEVRQHLGSTTPNQSTI